MASGSSIPAADWYPDPLDPAGIRYWDGAQWTEHTAPALAVGAARASADVVAQSGPASPMPGGAPSDRSPRRSRKRLVALIVGACALALLLGGGLIVARVLDSGPRSATAVVKAYVDAVAAGDATTANRLSHQDIPEASRKMLTDEAMGPTEMLRISVGTVRLIRQDDSSATVEVALSLNDKDFRRRFTLHKGPNDLLVLDNWELRDGLARAVTATVASPGSVTVGPVGFSGGKQWMYPGVYALQVAESAYFNAGSQVFTVTPEQGPALNVALEPLPTAAFTDTVMAAVRDRVSACVAVPTNMDAACPAVTRNTDLDSLSVVTEPSGLASLSADRFESEAATIVTQANTHGGFTPPARRTSFALKGRISWQGGEPEITFDAQ